MKIERAFFRVHFLLGALGLFVAIPLHVLFATEVEEVEEVEIEDVTKDEQDKGKQPNDSAQKLSNAQIEKLVKERVEEYAELILKDDYSRSYISRDKIEAFVRRV